MDLPDFLAQDPDGFIRVTGHRIGIQHVLHYYNEGYSAEMLASQYDTLSLPLLHRLIAFYLENQLEVDAYIARCQDEIVRQRSAHVPGPSIAELRQRLAPPQHAGSV